MLIMGKWVAKLPQIQYSWNNLNLDCSYLVIQGVNWYEQRFWTAANICDLGQQGDLYTNDHSGNTKALNILKLWHGFKFSPILADSCRIWTLTKSRHYTNYILFSPSTDDPIHKENKWHEIIETLTFLPYSVFYSIYFDVLPLHCLPASTCCPSRQTTTSLLRAPGLMSSQKRTILSPKKRYQVTLAHQAEWVRYCWAGVCILCGSKSDVLAVSRCAAVWRM